MAATGEQFRLSILDQKICRHYIRLAYIFPFQDSGSSVDQATKQLKDGMRETLQALPWLAGQLISRESREPNPLIQLKYSQNIIDADVDNVLRVEIRVDSLPSFTKIARRGAEPNMIKGEALCDLPESPGYYEPSPVMSVTANIIRGGLILVFYVSHAVMDGHGLGQLIEIFSNNVRAKHPGEQSEMANKKEPDRIDSHQDGTRQRLVTLESVIAENQQARTGIDQRSLQFLDQHPNPLCEEFVTDPNRPIVRNRTSLHTEGKMVLFDAQSIADVRRKIADSENTDNEISRWETLAAIIWTSITGARYSNKGLNSITEIHKTRLGFTVDARKAAEPLHIRLPGVYLGNFVLYTFAETTISSLQDYDSLKSLARAAHSIRQAREDFTPKEMEKRFAFIETLRENQRLPCSINFVHGPDVFMNSWERIAPEADFNIVGTTGNDIEQRLKDLDLDMEAYQPGMAAFIRKPGCEPTDGAVIVMPRRGWKNSDGGAPYEMLIQLESDDMRRLKWPEGVGLRWKWGGEEWRVE